MLDNNSTKVFAKDPNIVTRKVAGEIVLVPIRDGTGEISNIYTLNDVGGRVWELVDGNLTTGQIRDTIVAEYAVTSERAEADILEFLADLNRFGAISAVTGDNAGKPDTNQKA